MAKKVFTRARWAGLVELAYNGGEARISNQTGAGTVYWQTADWLIDHKFATRIGTERLLITPLGSQTWEAQR